MNIYMSIWWIYNIYMYEYILYMYILAFACSGTLVIKEIE